MKFIGKKPVSEHKLPEEYTTKDIKELLKENEKLKTQTSEKLLECFQTRRSIHKFETEKKVPWKDIYKIIEAGSGAPAAGNVQNYQFIVVSDPTTKREIGNRFGQQYWISDASTLILVLRDDYHLRKMFPESGEKLCIQNISVVVENMLMAAHIMGYGSCWVAANDTQLVKDYLEIPAEIYLETILPVGYSLEIPKIKKEDIVSKIDFDKFGNKVRK